MRIRPLHKTLAGNYESDDKEWLFVGSSYSNTRRRYENWDVYQRMSDGSFHKDTCYFFFPHSTLKSLIFTLEKPEKKK